MRRILPESPGNRKRRMKPKRDYSKFYETITAGLRKKENASQLLTAADRLLAAVMYAAYPVLLVVTAMRETEVRVTVLSYILVPGISFLLLSFVRSRINRKRPYEEWKIDPLIHREGMGNSMPSRHVFSAVLISMCILRQNVFLGVIFLILSACIAVVRVLGGVHYPRDVIAGYLIGAAAGSLLWAGGFVNPAQNSWTCFFIVK